MSILLLYVPRFFCIYANTPHTRVLLLLLLLVLLLLLLLLLPKCRLEGLHLTIGALLELILDALIELDPI